MIKITISKTAINKMVEENIKTALILSGAGIAKRVKESMTAGSGRTYTVGGETHVASAPGRPPAPWSGKLRDSITYHTDFGDHSTPGPSADSGDGVKKPQGAMGGHVVSIGSNVSYALAMEMGERKHNVAARPYLWPALKGSRQIIRKAFERV